MNCHEVSDLLSAYFDGELGKEQHTNVDAHIAGCTRCQADVAAFQQLSNMAQVLGTPVPPANGWQRLEEQLEKQQVRQNVRKRRTSSTIRVAVALTIVAVLTLSWFVFKASQNQHADHFTHEFGQYLEQFRRDPEAAQQYLLGLYESQKVDLETAIHTIGYRPAVADGVPSGYTAKTTHVIKMPCCRCVQTICKRNDGSPLALFEHDDEETDEWFGHRPKINVRCQGKSCCIVDTNQQLAATWKRGSRFLTVVGIRDVAELTTIIAWLDRTQSADPGKGRTQH